MLVPKPSYTPMRLCEIPEQEYVRQIPGNAASLSSCITLFLTLVLCSSSLLAAWQPTLSERDIAAINDAVILQQSPKTRIGIRTQSNHPLGLQVLLVELQETKSRKPDDALLAEVFLYDYQTNLAKRLVMDADTHELIGSYAINDIHLPLSETEIEFAINVLLDTEEFLFALNREYETHFGASIKSILELETKVSIWDPGPNNTNTVCNESRCALVSVFTRDHFIFSIEPIIVLDDSSVHLDWIQ